jgi:RES domain-containing protein
MNKPFRYSPPSRNGFMTPSGWHQAVNVPPGLNPLPGGDYTFPGLYVAEHPDTAYMEANQEALQRLRAGLPMPHLPALSMLGLEHQAAALDLLDLTHPPDLNTIGMTRRQIVRSWNTINTVGPGLAGEWAPTQILGYLAYQDPRFHGIRYPSARNRGRPCVFIFTDKLIPRTHRITVGDDPNPVPPQQAAHCCGLALEAIP